MWRLLFCMRLERGSCLHGLLAIGGLMPRYPKPIASTNFSVPVSGRISL